MSDPRQSGLDWEQLLLHPPTWLVGLVLFLATAKVCGNFIKETFHIIFEHFEPPNHIIAIVEMFTLMLIGGLVIHSWFNLESLAHPKEGEPSPSIANYDKYLLLIVFLVVAKHSLDVMIAVKILGKRGPKK